MIDERLEYPLPLLSVDTDHLMIETTGRSEGRFQIKNGGGSTLNGFILSRTELISFEPSEWEGNDVKITYKLSETAFLKPGEVLESAVYVCSNGGEKRIPITIKTIKMAIPTTEGRTIANIRDFFDYSREHPAKARRMFTDSEFYMLLLATGYPHMEAYEILHKDANRDRAMDNFFILSGIKNKTSLTLQHKSLEFSRKPYETDLIQGHFLAQKSDPGFVEVPIAALNSAPWLTLSAQRIIPSDFNDANTATVNFTINPLYIKGNYAKETVTVGTDALDIIFKRRQFLEVRLGREAYRFEDKGAIQIINHTGGELLIELFCKDNFIRFAARRYMVGEYYEIPFDIKLSGFMSAQLLFRKLPFLKTVVEVKTVYRDQLIKRQFDVVVGKW